MTLLLMLGSAGVQAQALDGLSRASLGGDVAFYRYAQSGDLTIEVHVWGAVRNAGLYEVTQGTHLNTLLTISGGPQLGSTSATVDRSLVVRLIRDTGAGQEVLYENRMENEILVIGDNPVLQDGDLLVVESFARERFNFRRDVLPFITAAASLTLVFDRLILR